MQDPALQLSKSKRWRLLQEANEKQLSRSQISDEAFTQLQAISMLSHRHNVKNNEEGKLMVFPLDYIKQE